MSCYPRVSPFVCFMPFKPPFRALAQGWKGVFAPSFRTGLRAKWHFRASCLEHKVEAIPVHRQVPLYTGVTTQRDTRSASTPREQEAGASGLLWKRDK